MIQRLNEIKARVAYFKLGERLTSAQMVNDFEFLFFQIDKLNLRMSTMDRIHHQALSSVRELQEQILIATETLEYLLPRCREEAGYIRARLQFLRRDAA